MPAQAIYNLGAGAIEIPRIDLVSCVGEVISLKNKFITLNIFEDMFKVAMHGFIVVIDSQNMIDLLPIVGDEKLRVKFYAANYGDPDPNNYIEKEFDIYRVSDIVHETDYNKRYTLHFVSPELRRNSLMRVSKGYADLRISEIVKGLFTENYEDLEQPVTGLGFSQTPNPSPRDLKYVSPFLTTDDVEAVLLEKSEFSHRELFIEKTKYTEPAVTLPYMKPFDAVEFLAARAIRHSAGRSQEGTTTDALNESANFVLFENKRGYNFISIDTLLEKKVKEIASVIRFGSSNQNLSREDVVNSATSLNIYNVFDTIAAAQNGLYASKMLSYDMMTGEVNEIEYDYLEKFKKTESANTGTNELVRPLMKVDGSFTNPASKRSDAMRIFVHNGGFSRDTDIITSDVTERLNPSKIEVGTEEFLQKRINQLARLNAWKIVLSVPGNSKHKTGDMIYLDYRRFDGNTNTVEKSKYYSGYYLITAIRHQVSNERYDMIIEIVKDTVNSKIGGR